MAADTSDIGQRCQECETPLILASNHLTCPACGLVSEYFQPSPVILDNLSNRGRFFVYNFKPGDVCDPVGRRKYYHLHHVQRTYGFKFADDHRHHLLFNDIANKFSLPPLIMQTAVYLFIKTLRTYYIQSDEHVHIRIAVSCVIIAAAMHDKSHYIPAKSLYPFIHSLGHRRFNGRVFFNTMKDYPFLFQFYKHTSFAVRIRNHQNLIYSKFITYPGVEARFIQRQFPVSFSEYGKQLNCTMNNVLCEARRLIKYRAVNPHRLSCGALIYSNIAVTKKYEISRFLNQAFFSTVLDVPPAYIRDGLTEVRRIIGRNNYCHTRGYRQNMNRQI